jgi:Icc-related predicted phosphoesterase
MSQTASRDVVRVAAMSDMHGRLPPVEDIPPAALLLIAGDICPLEDHSLVAQHLWLRDVFAPWLDELAARGTVTAGVAGNHDFIFAAAVDSDVQIPMLNWTYLQDSETELAKLRIFGTPWVPHMPGWVFTAPKSYGGDFLTERFAEIPEGIDILVTHAPPMGFGDMTLDGRREGSEALLHAIHYKPPRLVLSGHIHEGRGISRIATAGRSFPPTMANVSILNWDYQPIYGGVMLFDVPLDRSLPAVPVRE